MPFAPAPVPAVPVRATCRTFVPEASDTLVIDQVEHTPPDGVTVVNWADPTVARKDREGTRQRPACRAAADITELIVHETVSRTIDRGNTGRPNVHLVLHRDGTFTQHADLVLDLNHANHHNRVSFGFETVNPVLPRIANAPDNGLPPDLDAFPCIQSTAWASQDRPRDPETGRFGAPRNESRHYVRPTDAQLEAASRLIEWATDDSLEHGLGITRDWRGLRDDFLLFGRDDPLFENLDPGIYAHGYFHHSDGYLIVLYAWLRLEQSFTEADARDTAIDIAQNAIERRREPGGRRTHHANLQQALNPVGPPAPVPAEP